MQNTDNKFVAQTATPLTKDDLRLIKEELHRQFPKVYNLKVKFFITKKRITAHGDLGCRRMHVRGSIHTIRQNFAEQYQERFPTAFA